MKGRCATSLDVVSVATAGSEHFHRQQVSSTTTLCGSKTASISRVARRASYAKAMAAPPKTYTSAVKPRRASRSPSRPTERPRNRLPVKKRIIRAHATSNSCGATYTPRRRNAAGACATASTRAARELNGNHSRRNDRDSAQVGPDRPSRAARCSASAARKTSQRSSPVPAGSSSSNASRAGASSQPYSSSRSGPNVPPCEPPHPRRRRPAFRALHEPRSTKAAG